MTTSESAAIAADADRQPAQPVGAREQVADQPVGPQADRQRDQHAEAPRKIAPSRERRRGAIAGGGSLVAEIFLGEDVDFRRNDDGDLGFRQGARLARGLGRRLRPAAA